MTKPEYGMQNERRKKPGWFSFCILHSALCIYLTGCAGSPPTVAQQQQQQQQQQMAAEQSATLAAANDALAAKQPDAAISDAQSYLRAEPTGMQAAQAWYFEGRGYEMKIGADTGAVQSNLSQARTCYLEALQLSPAPSLEGDIRASFSNVAFFQDDFAEAIEQATSAIPLVTTPQTKAFLLFRIGLSQQRLGEFTGADQTFRQVEQRYPGTPLAAAALEHEGQRDFYVQLATYSSRDAADQALASLRASGVIISERTDAHGNTVIDDGPFNTYADAKKVKIQLQKNFPLATIVP